MAYITVANMFGHMFFQEKVELMRSSYSDSHKTQSPETTQSPEITRFASPVSLKSVSITSRR